MPGSRNAMQRKSPVTADQQTMDQLSGLPACWPGMHSGVLPSGHISSLTGAMVAVKSTFTHGTFQNCHSALDIKQTRERDCKKAGI